MTAPATVAGTMGWSRRVVLALVRDDIERVLLVAQARERGRTVSWGLAGGVVQDGEDDTVACRRALRQVAGLDLVPRRLLVDHELPLGHPQAAPLLVRVVDCGVIPRLARPRCRWVLPGTVGLYAGPATAWRIRAAFTALQSGRVQHLTGPARRPPRRPPPPRRRR